MSCPVRRLLESLMGCPADRTHATWINGLGRALGLTAAPGNTGAPRNSVLDQLDDAVRAA